MKYNINDKSLTTQKTDCIILGVYEKGKFTDHAKLVDAASDKYLSKMKRREDFNGNLGATLLLQSVPGIKAERVLLVGLGPEKPFSRSNYHKALKAMMKALLSTASKTAINSLAEVAAQTYCDKWCVRQAIMVCEDITYQYDATKGAKVKKHMLAEMSFTLNNKLTRLGVTRGQHMSAGIKLAKDLANLPANICTPTYLAKQATQLAKQFPSITSKVLNEAQMKKLGMNSLLSVSAGSHQPAKLIIMEYKGAKNKAAKPIVLVGKGITFDTGGISLKPGANMDEMKFDMGGAASVFGTIRALAEMKLAANVIGIVAAAENMPGGSATKPGDVFKTMSGKTVEVLNTDAEGRLVLCDALTYADRFKPEVVIDIATLTGAMVVSLGADVTGFFTNNDQLAEDLKSAAEIGHDPAWQMPLWRDYDEQLKSNFADLQNIGSRWGGAITAACFLAQFTENYTWAHLDVAGTASVSGANKGATGRPVPLLVQYILDRCS